jgi:tRNA pseudouridine13 synthase
VKVKSTPLDFVVREESSLTLRPERAEFAVFLLAKSSWDTFDLIDLLARRWGVQRDDISVGGMKDRHGSTEQRISVRGLRGAPVALSDTNFSMEFEGWSDHPVTARDVRGNRFAITLRDMSGPERDRIVENAPAIAKDGIPNYFDEQRFGSARHGAGFMGKEIFLGRREQALRLYFTPSKHDDQKTRKMKRCVVESWGQWSKCAGMGFGEYGRILAYLAANHRGYHQALERIDRKFLVFVLNAYQSFLFNEVLGRWLQAISVEEAFPLLPLRYAFGIYQFPAEVTARGQARMRGMVLPVPGYDTTEADPVVKSILEAVLQGEGIALSDLRVRQMHRIRVGGVERSALVLPEDFEADAPLPDDQYPGRWKVALRFFLPRGSYATMLIKRLTLPRAR